MWWTMVDPWLDPTHSLQQPLPHNRCVDYITPTLPHTAPCHPGPGWFFYELPTGSCDYCCCNTATFGAVKRRSAITTFPAFAAMFPLPPVGCRTYPPVTADRHSTACPVPSL